MQALQEILNVKNSAANQCWVMRPYEERAAMAMAQRHKLPEIITRILAQRDVEPEHALQYIEAKIRDFMPDPSLLVDMDKATARLADALIGQEKIAVFGDYDVDGASSAALILRYFEACGQAVRVYIPDRATEGYGPNVEAFRLLQKEGMRVIITCDCGTMAHDALAFAEQANMDVIVADHHQIGTQLPACFALINPRRGDDMSGLGYLAAVGVTYLLLVSLNRTLRRRGYFAGHKEPDLFNLLDIVALGTVCDVVPLQGLNRAFVKQGLKVMAKRQNIGIKVLADMARLNGAPSVFDCGFALGPRINAGGRIGDSMLGVRLLSTQNADEAVALATRMDELNNERRLIGDTALTIAETEIAARIEKQGSLPPVLVIADARFHIGILGIIAGRLKDKYRRPCFVLALDKEGMAKGSARSVRKVDIGGLVAKAVHAQIVKAGGGHAMAAGVTLAAEQLAGFENWLIEKCAAFDFDDPHYLHIDAMISTDCIHRAFYEQLQQAAPYGVGNPTPRFVIPTAHVTYADFVGDAKHVRCRLASNGGRNIKAIAFASTAENVRKLICDQSAPLHIAGYLRADDWQGREDVQFEIHDVAQA